MIWTSTIHNATLLPENAASHSYSSLNTFLLTKHLLFHCKTVIYFCLLIFSFYSKTKSERDDQQPNHSSVFKIDKSWYIRHFWKRTVDATASKFATWQSGHGGAAKRNVKATPAPPLLPQTRRGRITIRSSYFILYSLNNLKQSEVALILSPEERKQLTIYSEIPASG